MNKAILIILFCITCFLESHAQQKKLLISYDKLKYNYLLEYYCLDTGQKVLDSTQADYIKNYMIWAKKNFTRRKGFFYFLIQSDIPDSNSARFAKFELVKKEFLKYGLAERQIKLIDLSAPDNHHNTWISGCPNGIMINVVPVVRKRKHDKLIFCDD